MSRDVRPLQDDCFAHDPKRMPAKDALELLRARVAPVVGRKTVGLSDAFGRNLAEVVVSARDAPGFDNVAVDGYAFARTSLGEGTTRLALLEGRAAAGHPFEGEVPSGSALRVLTGAPLPVGADTALMQEDVEREGDAVMIPAGVRRGANCRSRGEDIAHGQVVLEPGRKLRPQDVALAATAGRGTLEVFRPLRVALLSTGDELVEAGRPLPAGGTYDVNRPMLRALLDGLGCTTTDLGIGPDRAEVIERTVQDAAQSYDVLITSGGASRGDEDHMISTIAHLGRLHFWQIAVKPGRPLAFGQIGHAVTIGLPGNPVAAFVCFVRFARPVLSALAGGAWPQPQAFPIPAGFSMKKKPGRREYLRGFLRPAPDGRPMAQRVTREGSGIVTSLTDATGLIEVPEDVTRIAEGDLVDFVPFSEFGIRA